MNQALYAHMNNKRKMKKKKQKKPGLHSWEVALQLHGKQGGLFSMIDCSITL
jgi:hypothetical protein